MISILKKKNILLIFLEIPTTKKKNIKITLIKFRLIQFAFIQNRDTQIHKRFKFARCKRAFQTF